MYPNTTIELCYVIGASISTQSATAANIVTGGMDETEKCKLFRNFHLKKAKGKLTRSIWTSHRFEQRRKIIFIFILTFRVRAEAERSRSGQRTQAKIKRCFAKLIISNQYNFVFRRTNIHIIIFIVPEIKWSFIKEASLVDKKIYQQLDKSDIWVRKQKLEELQAKAKDMDEYARKLMWKILVPADEVIALSQKKVRGVGFVKMFGKKNLDSFFGKSKNCKTMFCCTSF